MTYDTREISILDGADVRLYQFQIGQQIWRFCSGDRDTKYAGGTYYATPISDNGLKQKGQATTDDFIVNVLTSNPVSRLFLGTPPSQRVKMTMRQQQFGDDAEAPIMWVGYVASVKIKDEITSEILCNSQTAFLHRTGLRLAYTRECPHALYDDECGVDKSLWAEPVTITGTNGAALVYNYVNAPRSDNRIGRFTNGFLEWTPTLNGQPAQYTERRAIQDHTDQPVECVLLLGQTDGLAIGMTVTLYPGCDRSPANCVLFNNIPNYGGFPFLPYDSPFDGNPVW